MTNQFCRGILKIVSLLFLLMAFVISNADAIDQCGVNADADVVILLDRTYSISSIDELAYQRAAAKTLLNYFQSATMKPRVAIGQFAGLEGKIKISFTTDYNAVRSVLDTIIDTGGNTNLSVGINTAQTELATKATSQRSRYMIVFSDGVVNRPVCVNTECGCPDAYNAAFNAAQSARNANTQIFAVRFGDTGSCAKQTAMDFMRDSIASVPHFFFDAENNGSNLNSILENISEIIACEGPFSVGGLITKNNIGLPGVVTNLSGDMTKSATTGSDGRYLLDFIPYGTHYTVTPSGSGCTFAPPSRSGTLVENVSDANFAATGSTCGGTFAISGVVRACEGPVSGAVVSSGTGATTVTNASGQYLFSNIPFATTYAVTATLAGFSFSPGKNGVITSNVTSDITGTCGTFTLSGRVLADGVGQSGVTVSGVSGKSAVTTDSQGNFSFTDIARSASYSLVASKTGYTFSQRPSGTVRENISGLVISGSINKYTISGRVTDSLGAALPGVVISGVNGKSPVTTDSNGNFSFTGVPYGTTYALTASKPGYAFGAGPSGTVTGNVTDVSFVGTLNSYSVSGRVTDGLGNPISDASVSGVPGKSPVTTDINGNFSFENIPHGTLYSIIVTHGCYSFQPHVGGIVNGNVDNLMIIGSMNYYSITGRVVDAVGNGVSGAAVSGVSGFSPVMTDANGYFTIPGISCGTPYAITVSKDGYSFPNGPSGTITSDIPGVTVRGTLNAYTISGRVTDGFGSPISGTVVSGVPGRVPVVTGSDGFFVFSQVPYGTLYSIIATNGCYTFGSPIGGIVTQDKNNMIIGALNYYAISGRILDGAGNPIAGAVVSGVSGYSPVLTDANGNFMFANIACGTPYNLVVTKEGFNFPSGPGGILSENVTGVNITGVIQTYTISGQVLESGVGKAGVLINGGALGTRTSDNNGFYSFVGVPYGSSFTITPSLNEYTFSPPSVSGVVTGNVQANFVAAYQGIVVPEGCTRSIITNDKVLIDEGIIRLHEIGIDALGFLDRGSKLMLKSKKAKQRAMAKRGLRSVKQAKTKINNWFKQNQALIVAYPNVIVDCPLVPAECVKNDYAEDIAIFVKNSNGIYKEVNRLITRYGFINRPVRQRARVIALRSQARVELGRLIQVAQSVPTQTSVCTTGSGA